MSKYGIGDNVKAVASEPTGNVGTIIGEIDSEWKYVVKFDSWFNGHDGNGYITAEPGSKNYWFFKESEIKRANSSEKIIITHDNKTTLARLYEGDKVIKTAEAKCAPDDTFDFLRYGAKMAFNRLIEKEAEEPQEKPIEPIKLYCVKEYEPGRFLTKGKIYDISDGYIKYDCGDSLRWIGTNHMDGGPVLGYYCVPLVSRAAKAGEWVYVTGSDGNMYEINKAYRVYAVTKFGNRVYFADDCKGTVKQSEYLVLDGYQPEPAKPQYFSGRVVCVEKEDGYWEKDILVGKTYEIKDGRFIYDNGDTSKQIYTDIPGKSEPFVLAKFILAVD